MKQDAVEDFEKLRQVIVRQTKEWKNLWEPPIDNLSDINIVWLDCMIRNGINDKEFEWASSRVINTLHVWPTPVRILELIKSEFGVNGRFGN